MKNIFYILLLLPTIIFAQYPSNSGQKITLGEQTTADGLVFRGVASIDTVTATSKITRANKQDTSAYILLDTVTNLLWHYKTGSNAWTQAGGGVSVTSFSAGTTGLSPSEATTGAVTLGGTLAVANGGTNTNTLNQNKVMVGNGTSGVLTPTNLHWDNTNSRLGILQTDPGFSLDIAGTIRSSHSTSGAYSAIFYNSNVNGEGLTTRGGSESNHNSLLIQTYNGEVNLFQIKGNGATRFETLVGTSSRPVYAAADGTISAASSITIKENISNLNYGLDKILQLQPKSFNYIDKNKYGEGLDIGFIAEDVYTIVPEATGTMNDGFIYFDAVRLIPILTKAIQEQQALIKTLEQRIINLENK